jgi:hypothetical protein
MGRFIKLDFTFSAIWGLSALSCVMGLGVDLGVDKVFGKPLVTKRVKDGVTYLSLNSNSVYHDLFKDISDIHSPQRPSLRKEAEQEFSLAQLAVLFGKQCSKGEIFYCGGSTSDQLFGKWSSISSSFSTYEDTTVPSRTENQKMNWMKGALLSHSTKKIFVFSMADGEGNKVDEEENLEAPCKAAQAANEGFVEAMQATFQDRKTIDQKELVESTVKAVAKAQENIINVVPSHSTAHLGLVVLLDKSKGAQLCFSCVGDCQLWSTCPDGKGNNNKVAHLTQATYDPDLKDRDDRGGYLGWWWHGAPEEAPLPDLRNFTAGYLGIPEKTKLFLISPGVHRNLSAEAIENKLKRDCLFFNAAEELVKAAKEQAQTEKGVKGDISCARVFVD